MFVYPDAAGKGAGDRLLKQSVEELGAPAKKEGTRFCTVLLPVNWPSLVNPAPRTRI